MATFEEEFERLKPAAIKLSNFALLGKKVKVNGENNFVKEGPNMIIGNHCGSFKDVATLVKIVPRPIFFVANKMIFSKEEFSTLIRRHLRRHLKNFGLFLDLILNPLKSLFVNYISSNIAKAGTIPVDLINRQKTALKRFQEYLKQGRAIIALQGRGRVIMKDPHPYVSSFKRGSSVIAYNLYKNEGISVPVTPIAFFGTHVPFMIPMKILVNVGGPMYISDYLRGGEEESIEKFRSAMEAKVKELFFEIIRRKK